MQTIMPPVSTPDNLFHDGDPTQGIEGTIVTAGHLNNEQGAIRDVQQELINVLALAAMEPDPTKQDQLATAISAIIGGSLPATFVTSVNTQTGDVTLDADDVGAAPANHTHPGTLPNPIALAAEDLNTLVTPNVYRQDSDTNATLALNYPEAKAGSLIVTGGAGVQQRYHVYNTSRIYTRAQYNVNAFTPWVLTYNTGNKPTPDELGAAAAGHGHTPDQCGAAPAIHGHTPEECGATPAAHGHTPDQCGAAPAVHGHNPADVGAAPAIHHHNAIDGNWDIISSSWGQVGTYAFAGRFDSGGQLSPGGVIVGSSLHLCNAEGTLVGVSPPGTWKVLGYSKGDRDYGSWNVTLFIRIV